MREIKFRAWDKIAKKLYEIDGLWFEEESVTFEGDGLGPQNKGRYVLQQYTGLKDKNDVEIYEGDIVASIERPDIWQALIYFEFGGYRIKDPQNRVGGQYNMYGLLYDIVGDEGNDYEIIGNIYENPELLGV